MSNADHEKQIAANRSLDFIQQDMLVGLGSGSTAAYAIRFLGDRVRDGLRIHGIPTSEASAQLARSVGIDVVAFDRHAEIDVTIDGADEIGPGLQLIKGGGGALLHEKIVAAASRRFIIIADSSKLVKRLGAFPLSVEAIPFGWPAVADRLHVLGANPVLRLTAAGQPFVTDEGNFILDCRFNVFPEAVVLAEELDSITGLVEHGLFLDLTDLVVIGRGDQTELLEAKS
ncbi:MAG: ribose-5-phosphate isomerase RpiA [Acidobacteriota bacterium]|nr:ribose-5-phosphate isomerase RpiA [Acidobacteriota bacterium]